MLLLLLAQNMGIVAAPVPLTAAGVPRREQWMGRINGRAVHGSYDEVMAMLRRAAEMDGAEAAIPIDDASNRELKRQARTKARAAVQQVDLGPNPYNVVNDINPSITRRAAADEAALAKTREQQLALRKAYSAAYEKAMVANAQLMMAQDAEDMDDMHDIVDLL